MLNKREDRERDGRAEGSLGRVNRGCVCLYTSFGRCAIGIEVAKDGGEALGRG